MIIRQNDKIKVHNTPFGRIYENDKGEIGNSVTTILSGFRANRSYWSNDAANFGTSAHYEILKEYNPSQEKPEIVYRNMTSEEVNARMESALSMWNNTVHIDEVIECEFTVFDGEISAAGRGDIVSRTGDEVTLGDLKTGDFYSHYPYQLGGYFFMLDPEIQRIVTRGALYMLDTNTRRNPDQIARIIWYPRSELIYYAMGFVQKCEEYNSRMRAWIEAMG